jgi:hypothetical protein
MACTLVANEVQWPNPVMPPAENPMATSSPRPTNLQELRDSGWVSKSVKDEIRDNFLRALAAGEELFPGMVGYENTVIPEISIAVIAGLSLSSLGGLIGLTRLGVRLHVEGDHHRVVAGGEVHVGLVDRADRRVEDLELGAFDRARKRKRLAGFNRNHRHQFIRRQQAVAFDDDIRDVRLDAFLDAEDHD